MAAASGSLEERFIAALLDSGALLRGEFKLKSGRTSPYFIDIGRIPDGPTLAAVGRCYAEKIVRDVGADSFDVLFGPAYKAIPLAVATSIALHAQFGIAKGYAFNRKHKKEYGEVSLFLGARLERGARLLIIDDVLTDGGTKVETIDLLAANADLRPMGTLVGVDRSDGPAVVTTFQERTKTQFWSIVTFARVAEIDAAKRPR
jgi:orotate phosphoribosyltransferase